MKPEQITHSHTHYTHTLTQLTVINHAHRESVMTIWARCARNESVGYQYNTSASCLHCGNPHFPLTHLKGSKQVHWALGECDHNMCVAPWTGLPTLCFRGAGATSAGGVHTVELLISHSHHLACVSTWSAHWKLELKQTGFTTLYVMHVLKWKLESAAADWCGYRIDAYTHQLMAHCIYTYIHTQSVLEDSHCGALTNICSRPNWAHLSQLLVSTWHAYTHKMPFWASHIIIPYLNNLLYVTFPHILSCAHKLATPLVQGATPTSAADRSM